MINQLNDIPTREEERLIDAITALINFACKGSKELVDLEAEMMQSVSKLEELHPEYCLKKAQIIESFVKALKGAYR